MLHFQMGFDAELKAAATVSTAASRGVFIIDNELMR